MNAMPAVSQLSPQQQAVTDFVLKGRGSVNIVARAGCGKTHTLVHGVILPIYKSRPRDGMAVMAYNKAAADEIDARVKKLGIGSQPDDWKRIQVGTFHSFGFKAWRRAYPDVKVERKKVDRILAVFSCDADGVVDEASPYLLHADVIKHLVSLGKQKAMGFLRPVGDRAAWYNIVDHFGLDEELTDEVTVDQLVDWAIRTLNRSFELDREMIDFDDMILAPLVHKAQIWQWDWVIPDEAQDTNDARRALAFAMMKPKWGRMVACGDDRQAIYGFTGADADSMDRIKKALNSRVLPLNVTYRCPKAVVALAQQFVPDFVAHPDAPEGIVRSLPYSRENTDGQNRIRWFEGEGLKYGDAIICRNTAPLVEEAYSLIRAGIGCVIEGREIGSGLVALVTRWKSIKRLVALREKLEDYRIRQVAKYQAKDQAEKADQLEDKVSAIQAMIDRCTNEGKTEVSDLVALIESLFGDSDDDNAPKVLRLMTAHRSKGREFDRVFCLGRRKFMPSPWAKKPHQAVQEENLEYVTVTRTKREYIDIVLEA